MQVVAGYALTIIALVLLVETTPLMEALFMHFLKVLGLVLRFGLGLDCDLGF